VKQQVVVFDLDGTLVNSAPGITRVLDVMRAERNLPPCDVQAVRRWIGLGAEDLVKAALEVASDEVPGALIEFRSRYGRTATPREDMYPGTPEALQRLRDAGAKLGVCSNKPHALTERVLMDLGIRPLFDAVVGGDAVAACKPHPMHLHETLARMGCTGQPFVFVGDSLIDAEAATASGARFVWVSYGYGEASDLSHRGTTVDSTSEIVDVILFQAA
jgi:phosphoglycolate phosphatase